MVGNNQSASWHSSRFEILSSPHGLNLLKEEIVGSSPELKNLNLINSVYAKELCGSVLVRSLDMDFMELITSISGEESWKLGSVALVQLIAHFMKLKDCLDHPVDLRDKVAFLEKGNEKLLVKCDELPLIKSRIFDMEQRLAEKFVEISQLNHELSYLRENDRKLKADLVETINKKRTVDFSKENLSTEVNDLKSYINSLNLSQVRVKVVDDFKASSAYTDEVTNLGREYENRRAAHIIKSLWSYVEDKDLLVKIFLDPFDSMEARKNSAFLPFFDLELDFIYSKDVSAGISWDPPPVAPLTFWEMVEKENQLRSLHDVLNLSSVPEINSPRTNDDFVPFGEGTSKKD